MPNHENHPYAGLGPRAAALALDFLIIAGYAAVLAIFSILLLLTTSIEERLDSPWIRDLVAFVTLILPVILYFAFQEGSSRQATLGKRKMKLKVIDQHGRRLGLGRALLRSGLKFLPWQLAHTTVFQIWAGNTSPLLFGLSILAQLLVVVYLLSLWLNKRHRTPYDWLAGTGVIKDQGDDPGSP
jgi:uncharacterized RDD family membrane protein YckC